MPSTVMVTDAPLTPVMEAPGSRVSRVSVDWAVTAQLEVLSRVMWTPWTVLHSVSRTQLRSSQSRHSQFQSAMVPDTTCPVSLVLDRFRFKVAPGRTQLAEKAGIPCNWGWDPL